MLPIIKHLDSINTDIPVILLDFSSFLRFQGHNMAIVASDPIYGIKVGKRGNDNINVNYFFC